MTRSMALQAIICGGPVRYLRSLGWGLPEVGVVATHFRSVLVMRVSLGFAETVSALLSMYDGDENQQQSRLAQE